MPIITQGHLEMMMLPILRLILSMGRRCLSTSVIPITDKAEISKLDSKPALIMRGPPIPIKRALGSMRLMASISPAPRISPEISPAVMA